jgi:hypothetical protein
VKERDNSGEKQRKRSLLNYEGSGEGWRLVKAKAEKPTGVAGEATDSRRR